MRKISVPYFSLLIVWVFTGLPVTATDIRVALTTVATTYMGTPIQFLKGGRVGNWLSGTGNVIVLDGNINVTLPTPTYLTNIVTLPASGGALSLISNASTWTGGDGTSTHIPAAGYYLGNPWFCPGSASSAYILFQAQNSGSTVGVFGQPGGGYDNDIWLYRPAVGSAPPKVWKITNYGNSLGAAGSLGPAVLGPQCSQDSSSSLNKLSIVYGRLFPNGAPTSTCNTGNGPSDGTCWWFGQWELVYGDINFSGGDPAIDPACTGGGCNEPYLVHNTMTGEPYHVSPRDQACNPICPVTGTGASLTGKTLSIPSVSGTITTAAVGAGIYLNLNSGGPFYTTVTCFNGFAGDYAALGVSCPTGTSSLKINQTPPSSISGSFGIKNYAVYEPHWYVSRLGNLYLSSNHRPVYHDAVGLVYGFSAGTSTSRFQELNGDSPPYVAGGPANTGFNNVFWNEFLTPDPNLAHFIFMSDRATNPSNFSTNPEYSDHYMCTGPTCSNITRLTYFNDLGHDSTLPACTPDPAGCFPITAVRGAFSPDGTQYITLVEYLARTDYTNMFPGAVLYNYALTYPDTEVSKGVKIGGGVKISHCSPANCNSGLPPPP